MRARRSVQLAVALGAALVASGGVAFGRSAADAAAGTPTGGSVSASPLAVAQARECFARGIAHFREGAPEAALAEFVRANELAPSYRLQFNIAQVQFELRNYVEAQRAFRRYLAEGGAEIPADRRVMVEGELAKLEAMVVQLSIRTSVNDAQIVVDEIEQGRVGTANLIVLSVNPGLRRVTASKAGFLPATLAVTALPGERRRLAFELAPVARVAVGVTARAAPADGSRVNAWIAFASTAALAVSTGVFAVATRNAHDDFERQLGRVPNQRTTVDESRHRLRTLALVTDILAAATAVSTGVFLYFTFTEGPKEPAHATGLGFRGHF